MILECGIGSWVSDVKRERVPEQFIKVIRTVKRWNKLNDKKTYNSPLSALWSSQYLEGKLRRKPIRTAKRHRKKSSSARKRLRQMHKTHRNGKFVSCNYVLENESRLLKQLIEAGVKDPVDCVSLTLVVVTSKAGVSVWGTVETNTRKAGQNHAEVIATRKLLDKILEKIKDIVKMELLICHVLLLPKQRICNVVQLARVHWLAYFRHTRQQIQILT